MKKFFVNIGKMVVCKNQLTLIDLFRRPLDDDDPDRPLKKLVPVTMFNQRKNVSFQRLRLVKRICQELIKTLAIEMIDNGNFFQFPYGRAGLRCGIVNFGTDKKSYWPHIGYNNRIEGLNKEYGRRAHAGYKWEVRFGKHLYFRLKYKVMDGMAYRNIKDL